MSEGVFPSAPRRKPKPGAAVAARVASLCPPCAVPPEGVQPLNPGFFQLEAMRQASIERNKGRTVKGRNVRTR